MTSANDAAPAAAGTTARTRDKHRSYVAGAVILALIAFFAIGLDRQWFGEGSLNAPPKLPSVQQADVHSPSSPAAKADTRVGMRGPSVATGGRHPDKGTMAKAARQQWVLVPGQPGDPGCKDTGPETFRCPNKWVRSAEARKDP